jgi:hypothetical protein
MLPTAARWNVRATIERETIEHESAHAVAAHRLGFQVGEIVLDRWGDFDGELGSVRFKWAGAIDDVEELSFARAIVAAAGPLVTDSWDLERSRRDRGQGRGGQVAGVVEGCVGVRRRPQDRGTRPLRAVPSTSRACRRRARRGGRGRHPVRRRARSSSRRRAPIRGAAPLSRHLRPGPMHVGWRGGLPGSGRRSDTSGPSPFGDHDERDPPSGRPTADPACGVGSRGAAGWTARALAAPSRGS